MNLENVKSFVNLVEALNFTKAAEKEHITQSTMSRRINRLENELKVLITMNEGSRTQLIHHFKHVFTVHDFIYVNSYETKAMMVNAGLGIGLFPQFVTLDHYANVSLKPLQPPYRSRRFYILCRKDNPNSSVHQFMNLYTEYILSRK